MSVIFVLLHVFGQVIDIELWYTKRITFVSSHNLKDGSIFQLCWKRSVPMIGWHVVSDWTVCLRSNFKDRSTSSSVMYTLVQYTPIIHPFSHVEDDVLSASQRLIWSNFRCDGTRSVRTSEAVTLHFFFVKPAFRFSTWSRNWKRSIMYPPVTTADLLGIIHTTAQYAAVGKNQF